MFKKLINLAKSTYELFTLKEAVFLTKLRKKTERKVISPIMVTSTYIGSAGAIWFIPALIMMRNKKYRFDGILVIAGITTDVFVNTLVSKFLFHRRRPWTRLPSVKSFSSLSLGYSFPSGHALTSATAGTIFILSNKLNIIWALPLASLISFSRAYLFAHYPSDIIVGIIDGVITGKLFYYEGHKLLKEGKLKFIERIIKNNYFFNYFNLLNPLEYIEKLFKTIFI